MGWVPHYLLGFVLTQSALIQLPRTKQEKQQHNFNSLIFISHQSIKITIEAEVGKTWFFTQKKEKRRQKEVFAKARTDGVSVWGARAAWSHSIIRGLIVAITALDYQLS